MKKIVVAALYKFAPLDDYRELKTPILDFLTKNGIKGTLLLASEGINGTVAGTRNAIDNLLKYLRKDPRLTDLEHKESFCDEQPFYRTKVKLKKEIVTLGIEGIDPNQQVGQYLNPAEWNDLIKDPDTLVIDTRNDYEVEIGTFRNAINPDTETFREFPAFVEKNLQDSKDKNIAMFCTGGIRCEKSTALMLKLGFKNVYHLKGGILKYLEETKPEESMWQGECFVFDNRVAVNEKLEPGQHSICHGCRQPLNPEDLKSPNYKIGVHCPRCHDKLSTDQLQRFAERQKQINLAKEKNQEHLGVNPRES